MISAAIYHMLTKQKDVQLFVIIIKNVNVHLKKKKEEKKTNSLTRLSRHLDRGTKRLQPSISVPASSFFPKAYFKEADITSVALNVLVEHAGSYSTLPRYTQDHNLHTATLRKKWKRSLWRITICSRPMEAAQPDITSCSLHILCGFHTSIIAYSF